MADAVERSSVLQCERLSRQASSTSAASIARRGTVGRFVIEVAALDHVSRVSLGDRGQPLVPFERRQQACRASVASNTTGA